MSLVDLTKEASQAVEPHVVEADQEYEVRVIDANSDTDKNGNPYVLLRLEIPSEPESLDFTFFLGLPGEGATAKEINRKIMGKNGVNEVMTALGLPFEGKIDTDELRGQTGWAILGMKDDEQYGEQNYIKRWIARK